MTLCTPAGDPWFWRAPDISDLRDHPITLVCAPIWEPSVSFAVPAGSHPEPSPIIFQGHLCKLLLSDGSMGLDKSGASGRQPPRRQEIGGPWPPSTRHQRQRSPWAPAPLCGVFSFHFSQQRVNPAWSLCLWLRAPVACSPSFLLPQASITSISD